MNKISDENTYKLKEIINDEKNKQMIIDLTTNILGLNVSSMQFECIKSFDNISEYKFSVIKTVCNLDITDKIDIYFKIIRKDRIKESIFCYWCLLYEEALKEKRDELSMASIINKVVISEIGMERYKNSVFLEIKDNKTDILKYGTEVHFIDFIKYIKKHKKDKNDLGKWLEYIDKDSEEILMVGIVLNKDIGRCNIKIV